MKIDISVLRVPAIALITAFLAVNALPQTLTAPPNQTPPAGSNFSSTNQNTVTANAGGTITLDGGTVTLTKTIFNTANFTALLANGSGAIISATNVNVVDTNEAPSATATNINLSVNATSGGVVNLFGGQITAIGIGPNNRAYGINAGVGGIVNSQNVAIQTFGDNSNGVVAAGGTINLVGGSVTTNARSAIGLQANGNAGPATINVVGTTITTRGFLSFGVTVDGANASTINLKNATIVTTGAGAAGLGVLGNMPLSQTNQVTLDHTTITSRGDGIDWNGQSNGNITLENGSEINPESGVLVRGLAFGRGNLNLTATGDSVLTGAILDATNVSIENGSIWNVTDNSTVTQNLSIKGGVLAFQSSTKFAATGQASVLNVGGNYSMDSTLSLGIGGTNGNQYDRLQIQGKASLSGILDIGSVGGFRPVAGNAFAIILAGGGRTGEFAQVNDSLNNNPKLQLVNVYAPNGVALVYLAAAAPTPAPSPAPSPAPTPPPIIDVIPTPLPPVEPGAPLLLSFLLAALDPTAEELTSMFEIPFSGANTQRFNLNDRMTQIQRGSAGFVSPISPVSPPAPTGKDIGKKEVIPPVFTPGPTNRWGVWVNGWGDWVSVDSDNSIKGYDFTTGGVSVGLDYRITNCLAVGIFGTYAHTWTSLSPGDVDVNTGRGGLYATYWNQGFYVNGGVYGGYNSYDTSRQTLLQGRLANGDTEGYEFSTFVDTGYDFHFGNLSVGPVFAAQYTNVHVDGFTEHGAFLPLNIHDDSEESWRTDLGVQASYTWHVGNIIVIPSLWAAWEHEYKYNRLPITFSSVDFPGVSATTFGPHEGHDSAIINAGVGTQWTPRISTYVGYQGQLGRDNYSANGVTGTISFSF
jgi:outer membrane autotransporter protein